MSLCTLIERFALGLLPTGSVRPVEVVPAEWDIPDTHKRHAENLVDKAVTLSVPYMDREHSVSRVGSDPDLIGFTTAFIKELKRRGMPFFVHELLRDKQAQDAYFARGVSKARWGQSAHNFGMAADIVHFGRYWELSRKEWAVIGLIGKEVARKQNLKITWGGDWTSIWDPAHWELADWKQRRFLSSS